MMTARGALGSHLLPLGLWCALALGGAGLGGTSVVVAAELELPADSLHEPSSQIHSSQSATDWMEQAAALRESQPIDWAAVKEAYSQAAALGSLPAMSHLGWMYEQGVLGQVDLKEAARWYEPVAEGGQDDFAIKLGWLYLQPELGPDQTQAERWFQVAVDRGSASARVALASVLVADAQGGLRIERIADAHDLLTTALQQGHPLASRFLARIHVEQIGDYPSTPESRLHYTRLAAEDGQALMQGWLAERYATGDGVEQDLLEGAFWAALAAANGDPAGQQLHQALQAQLSDEQKQEVLERTIAWALQ